MIEIPAYKDELRNTWYASFYYTDWQGKRRLKKKRGFQRKKDAQAFEEEFLRTRARSCDMTFRSFAEIYLGDMEPRLKRTTMQNKRYLIEHRVLPFFGDLPLNEITPAHVRKWQSQLLADKVAPTYAKTINNQLSAIFNYACKYYGLGINPARLAGSVGKKDAQEMSFWTVEQFNQFIPHVKKLPARTGLSVQFWTGLRIGELLALCPEDIDLEARTLTVRRNFQSVEGEEVITDPKTQRGRRVIPLPESCAMRYGPMRTPYTTPSRMTGYFRSRSTISGGRCSRGVRRPTWTLSGSTICAIPTPPCSSTWGRLSCW